MVVKPEAQTLTAARCPPHLLDLRERYMGAGQAVLWLSKGSLRFLYLFSGISVPSSTLGPDALTYPLPT